MGRSGAVGLVGLGAAEAARAAEVYVVHGIPGEDLGLDPRLPDDVEVDGSCVVAGLEFGDVEGPLSLDPGRYTFEISLASDGAGDCAGPLAVAGDFSLGRPADPAAVGRASALGGRSAAHLREAFLARSAAA